MAIDRDEILTGLARLRGRDRRFEMFGAKRHRYRLHPPLSEKRVAAVEKKYRMALPADYRQFIIEVGNGGAGPYYGLFKLGEEDDGVGHCSWAKGSVLGDPSKPFPHKRAWNLPARFFRQQPRYDRMDEAEADRAQEAWHAKVEAASGSHVMTGAIPICHRGCALRQWLVVTGREAGHIWNDDRADDKGIAPLVQPKRRRVTFAAWYMGWLRGTHR